MGIEIPPQLVASPVDVAQAPAFSDDALALEFADRHAENLRFVATWNKWLFWDRAHWRFEETLRAWDFAREVCRDAADDCNKIKAGTAPSIASAKTVAAVERMARSDRRLAATVDQWDADPWLLNSPTAWLIFEPARLARIGPKTT
jgi:putative DNA primase/helicase